MRLNRYLALCGLGSRRKVEDIIKRGKVKINGIVIDKPWYDVKGDDRVEVDGNRCRIKDFTYIILNKPRNILTTKRDDFGRRTVMSLLPEGLKHLFPVGRLDFDAGGLLLLTNDGKLAYRLTHPKFGVEKEYIVRIEGKVSDKTLQRIKRGVYIEGELYRVKGIKILRENKRDTLLKVILIEGKHREIKKVFKSQGFRVREIKRIRLGCIRLGNMKEGEWRKLTEREVERLKRAVRG